MDIRFLAKLREAGPTQFEQGRRLCAAIMETVDTATGRPHAPVRIEDAIVALCSNTIQMCVDGDYDPIAVTMMLIEAYDRAPTPGPRTRE
jgi:hypothetical protein